MTLLICNDGLIGDFLGVIPVVIDLSKRDELQMKIHPEASTVFSMIPKKYNIKLQEREDAFYDVILQMDISRAFTISSENNYYMSQAHFAFLGLDVPETPLKAELEFEEIGMEAYDYIIAPFSRSLPANQRWPMEEWQRLVELMPESTFCIIGHEREPRNFIMGPNVSEMYNEPLVKVINLLKSAKRGMISVVSGPSHLCFHLGVKNYLLTNQDMKWGINPEAITIENYIPELKAEKVIEILQRG
jgi:ADP-heptose:LPS heptosyltransferase